MFILFSLPLTSPLVFPCLTVIDFHLGSTFWLQFGLLFADVNAVSTFVSSLLQGREGTWAFLSAEDQLRLGRADHEFQSPTQSPRGQHKKEEAEQKRREADEDDQERIEDFQSPTHSPGGLYRNQRKETREDDLSSEDPDLLIDHTFASRSVRQTPTNETLSHGCD